MVDRRTSSWGRVSGGNHASAGWLQVWLVRALRIGVVSYRQAGNEK